MRDLSPPTRDWTQVPCIRRQILNHWTTREVLLQTFLANTCSKWRWQFNRDTHGNKKMRREIWIKHKLIMWWGLETGQGERAELQFQISQQLWVNCFFYSLNSGSDGKGSAFNEADLGSIPGLGWSPGVGNGNLLQYSCLKNPTDRRSLAGYHPWGCKESHVTERLTLSHF